MYQPLEGLHTPVVVDPTHENFSDVSLLVHCVPSSAVGDIGRRTLCRRVGRLFENQGATVEVVDGIGRSGWASSAVESDAPAEETTQTDLILELRPRSVPVDQHAESWLFFISTFTLLPGVVESPFAIDVTVRDGGGFLLSEDYLEGRVVSKYGVSPWLSAALANQTWRRGSEKSTRRAAAQRLSEDVYGQLSQLVYNAKTQWRVLQAAEAGVDQ